MTVENIPTWEHLNYFIPPAHPDESALEFDARQWASYWHKDQKRKYTGEPYIVHPAEVVSILRAHGVNDAVILSAAWLHDVVEDCGMTTAQLSTDFGSDVAWLVNEVTDVSRPEHGNRTLRKQLDLAHIKGASRSGKTIKLADLISNSKSIIKLDTNFAKTYLREKRAMLNVLWGAHRGLWDEADRICREAGY